ncbi:hypothetical protein COEREDRAFT_88963 [Coemansia reversa NRRL 1564]|uniref:SGNH hydrolase n=1 Tax=Coemansia reversa (strain ATCC 12441 / NRRL 1564) TaxID=763665 RepID=A0A2G5B539_COERN|nr:hypothetical protein COEREDRAFT_88963 [Coemansia reversa NRRL 1564]|eukprot:PIA14128.1 hypothetical protein COEREDRAFT_88963 [Coemansia reversa NRRL 1564]
MPTLLRSLGLFAWTVGATGVSRMAEDTGRIIMFGDDLGDTGNLQQLANDSSIGYNEGRMTNGPTFGEYMATALDLKLKSYAVAHSAVDSEWLNTTMHDIPTPGLDKQIVEFSGAERDWIRRKLGIHNSIAIVSSGTTDIINKMTNLTGAESQRELARGLVQRVFAQVEKLGKLEFKGIVVTNLPALYIMPRWRMLATVDVLHEFVAQCNALFRETLIEHEKSIRNTKLWMLDLEAFLLVTANNTFAETIGARNTIGSCIAPQKIGYNCEDPSDFVFYDDIHMDVRLNHLLGLATAKMVSGGDIQYNSTYFGQLARDYEIGVVYHTTATTTISASDLGSHAMHNQPGATTAGDPLFTSTQSSTANCSLTGICTAVSADATAGNEEFETNHEPQSHSSGWKLPAEPFLLYRPFTWPCIAGVGVALALLSL